jgi:hypothetical protein
MRRYVTRAEWHSPRTRDREGEKFSDSWKCAAWLS